MSSLVYGLDICVRGGDVRVSTGRCYIFVMKYIMHTYIQAGIMFVSFVVVGRLYLIHWSGSDMWQPHSVAYGANIRVCASESHDHTLEQI